jgi:uncharacterized protein (DUF2267 family)
MDPTQENAPFLEDLASRRVELLNNEAYDSFLLELCRLGKYSVEFAERAATSVLCVFDQELFAGNARNPDSTMPDVLKELVRGCNRPGELPPEGFDPETLLYTVADDLDVSDEKAEEVVRNVFAAVRRQLTHGQIELVARKLPSKIQNLWFGHEHAERRLGPTGKPRDR